MTTCTPCPRLAELAAIFRDAETIEELLGALRIWAEEDTTRESPNYRQQWALTFARNTGRVATRDLAGRFACSHETARLDLCQLAAAGLLRPVGDRRGRTYELCSVTQP